jgi:hypothetical protein
MDIPISVEIIASTAFVGSAALELRMASGTRIKVHDESGSFRAFVAYKDNYDVRQRRRQFHLDVLGLTVPNSLDRRIT